jgi:hypothetical protein
MSDEAWVVGPVARAIADFREEVLLWIDNALIRLRDRESGESRAIEQRFAPGTLARSGAERESEMPPSDSLKRLDALARLLDQRLKVPQEEGAAGSGASQVAAESNG